MKKINFLGVIVGLLFLGLAALFLKWSQTNKESGVMQGIVLFGAIGLFFIYQSYKGKSTSSIFKTDVGGVVGVSPGTSVWTYLKWVFLVILVIVVFAFLFASVTNYYYKSDNPKSWQNRFACLIHYNCIKTENFEPTSFKPYAKESQSYTYDNYWFYFTYPQTWQVEYKKNTNLADKQAQTMWEFKFEPLEGATSSPSSLSGSGTMDMILYKPYYEVGIDGFISDVLTNHKDDITAEGKKIGQTYIYYLNPKVGSTFKPQYAVIGTYHTYLMTFSNDTPKEIEDKITKYLFQFIFFK